MIERCLRIALGVSLLVLSSASACKTLPGPVTPAVPAPAPVVPVDRKMSWILRLEQMRVIREPGQTPAVSANAPDLAALAHDPDLIVRRRSVLALGRVGLPEAIPELVGLLADKDEYTRAMAAFSLGLLAAKGAVPPLQAALNDASPEVRARVVDALGLIGEASSAAAIATAAANCGPLIAPIEPDDEQWPKTPEIEVCRQSLFALVRLRQYEPLARVATNAQGQPVSRWWPVAYALQRINDPRAAPALLPLASGTGVYTRSFALRGLAGLNDRRVVPIAVAVIKDGTADIKLRVAAVRALAQLKQTTELPALVALVRDRRTPSNLLAEAVTAISAIGDPSSFDVLLSLLTHASPTIRAAAIAGAARVNPSGFVMVVSSLPPDRQWSVRAALANTLSTLPADQVRSALIELVADTDVRVQGPALEALAAVNAPDLANRLFTALDSPDVVVRATAARLIGEKKPADGVLRLAAAYGRTPVDPSYSARAAALDALSKYGGEEARATIRRALADADWAVRIKAADLLHAMGDATATPSLPAPLRVAPAVFESAGLLHPQYSPHAFLDTTLGTIEIELNVVDSPFTTQSFIDRARADFFEGVVVHRLVPNFVIQGGDPRGDGEGGPGYTLRDELGWRPYLRGTVGMALEWRETAGSQFFITVSPQPHLDEKYTVFGRVVAGMDILDRVSQWDTIVHVRVWDGITR